MNSLSHKMHTDQPTTDDDDDDDDMESEDDRWADFQ